MAPPKAAKRDIVQPVKYGREVNEPNGAEDGMIGGPLTGAVAAPPPPPPPPPPPAPPRNVSPQALDANRISGEKNIVPDDATKTEISRAGKDKLVGSYKLCITAEGSIKTVNQLKSTGFAAYDQKIMNTIRGEWRYRPFTVDGRATPVCTAVTFIYSQHEPLRPLPPPTAKCAEQAAYLQDFLRHLHASDPEVAPPWPTGDRRQDRHVDELLKAFRARVKPEDKGSHFLPLNMKETVPGELERLYARCPASLASLKKVDEVEANERWTYWYEAVDGLTSCACRADLATLRVFYYLIYRGPF
jgi:hypothetical protein